MQIKAQPNAKPIQFEWSKEMQFIFVEFKLYAPKPANECTINDFNGRKNDGCPQSICLIAK